MNSMRASLILTALLLLATPATAQVFQRDTLRAGPVLEEMTSPSAMACQAACDLNGQCAAWSWMHPSVNSAAAMCRLQTAQGVPQTDVCCISGVSRDSLQRPQPQIANAEPRQRPMTIARSEPAQAATPARQSPVVLMRPAPRAVSQQTSNPQPRSPRPVIAQTATAETPPSPIRRAAPEPAPRPVYVPYSARPKPANPQEEVTLNFDPTARGDDDSKDEEEADDDVETADKDSEATEAAPGSEAENAPQPDMDAPDTVAPALLRQEEPASRRPLYSVQREYAAPQGQVFEPESAPQSDE